METAFTPAGVGWGMESLCRAGWSCLPGTRWAWRGATHCGGTTESTKRHRDQGLGHPRPVFTDTQHRTTHETNINKLNVRPPDPPGGQATKAGCTCAHPRCSWAPQTARGQTRTPTPHMGSFREQKYKHNTQNRLPQT